MAIVEKFIIGIRLNNITVSDARDPFLSGITIN